VHFGSSVLSPQNMTNEIPYNNIDLSDINLENNHIMIRELRNAIYNG
jgi:predicted GNAT family N-acyltransferase